MSARLMRHPVSAAEPFHAEPSARLLLDTAQGFCRVLGGPGTGKTALLAEVVSRRIRDGEVDPERVMVLTASRRAAGSLLATITRRLTSDDGTTNARTAREPLVRTVHSYAFSVLRAQAVARGHAAPRLLSSAEQDVVIRELLAGDLEAGAVDWPPALRQSLAVPGFAEELRDLLLRAAERGLGPSDLIKVGRQRECAEWVAAGRFWRQYEEVSLLKGAGGSALAAPSSPAFDAAELVSAALFALQDDPHLRDQEQARVKHLFVDDAQHLDPLQFRLLNWLGSNADEFVLAGDPDQSVFSFRGADPRLLAEVDEDDSRTVVLGTNHRMGSAVRTAVSTFGSGLSGGRGHRESGARQNADPGSVRVRVFPTSATEASWVADQLRRAHLIDGIAWSDMAILVRSPARSIPVLQRALRAVGVPIASAGDELPLARQQGVRQLLTVLTVADSNSTLDSETAEMLLCSTIGGADPLALRRLRRGLRRLELAGGGTRSSDELLVEAMHDGDVLAGLGETEAAPVRRVAGLIAATRRAIESGAGVERVLWELWQGSGLERALLRKVRRGGSLAAQADRDLDAVVALFHAAGRYVDRLPKASVAGFVEYLSAQNIAGDNLAPTAARREGVELISAHAAAGREWTVVAVVGVQEGGWPDLRLRGSLLGVERLVDTLSGADGAGVSAHAPLLAEERRLFYLAVSRAKRTLVVSSVSGEDEQPSRFLDELTETGEQSVRDAQQLKPARSLVLSELIGELRSVVCAHNETDRRRRLAARQLARIASAGVGSAHPDNWYGQLEASADAPLYKEGEPITVSPSTVDTLASCPLRWLLERHGGTEPAQLAAITGTIVHALAQAAATGMDEAQLQAALDDAWSKVDAGAPWYSRRERRRIEQMMRNFMAWLEHSRNELSQIGVERDVEVTLPQAGETEETESPVQVRGRVDRLEVDFSGRPVIVDIKTGKTPMTAAETEAHPQLATYQLAALLGAFGEQHRTPGGATLVYVAKSHNKTGATQRAQRPLDGQARTQWLELVRTAALAAAGPRFEARENADCARCPARAACPLHGEGRQVTGP